MTQPADGWARLNANLESGTSYARKTDDRREALRSVESGPSAPVSPVQGMFWLDTSNQSHPRLKQYTGAAWTTHSVMDVANARIRHFLDSDHDTYMAYTGTDDQIGIYVEGTLRWIFSSAGLTAGSTASSLALDLSSLPSALALPRGTTAQRPSATGAPGMLYYNETLDEIQQSVGSQWEKVPVPGDIVGFKRGTEVSTPNAQRAEFTAIPVGTRVIHVIFTGVVHVVGSGSTWRVVMQLGDSGGYEATGYSNNGLEPGRTNGFAVIPNTAGTYNQTITLLNMSGNKWVLVGVGGATAPGGVKTLSHTLDRLRIGVAEGPTGAPDGTVRFANSGSGRIQILYT